jgi:hypothetical protein
MALTGQAKTDYQARLHAPQARQTGAVGQTGFATQEPVAGG